MAKVLPNPTYGGIDVWPIRGGFPVAALQSPYYFNPNPQPQPVYVVPNPSASSTSSSSGTSSTSTSSTSTASSAIGTIFGDFAAILSYVVQNWIVIVILIFAYMLLKKHFR